jgi:EAL and modified HD-GYP domain-containing signal transduction protein
VKTFVARQAIFDRRQKVAGYELLFRSSGLAKAFDGANGSRATSQLVANIFFSSGLADIVAGKRGFINFTRDLLVSDYASILPPDTTVIEILETVQPDSEVIKACQNLKERGYTLALDDFVCEKQFEPITPFVDIIKVDFQSTGQAAQEEFMKRFGQRGMKMLAEKVETVDQFARALKMGYTYFQGYFFARPMMLTGRQPPAFKLHYLELLTEVHRPELEYRQLEQVIKQEMSLAYKLLRYINSARFGWHGPVDSIRHALALLGEEEVRKWISLAIVSGMGEDKPQELVVTAMIRARFCELLGPPTGLSARKSDLFLLGMFSLLDAIMDRSLDEMLAELYLDQDVSDALLRQAPQDNRLAMVYELVRAYEAAEWSTVSANARKLGVSEDVVLALYLDSVQWSEQIFRCETRPL